MMPSHSRGAGVPGVAVIELTVRNGQSPLPRVAYQPGLPPTRSTMGSGGDVEWPLSAPGVELRHAEFAWDGASLWVRDVGSQRGTFVNGARIGTDWVPVQAGTEVRIGQALIVASGPPAAATRAPSRAEFDDDQPTSMVSDAIVPSGPLPKAPSTAMGPGDTGVSESTVIVQSPFDQSNLARGGAILPPKASFSVTDPHGAPAGAVPLPRIGAKPTGPGPALPMAPSTAPDNSEATVAFAIPDERPPAPPTFNTHAAPSTAAPFVSPTPFAPSNPMGGPPAGFPPMPPASAMSMPSAGTGGGSLPSIFGSIPPPPPEAPAAPKPVFTLPKRTLIMLGATFAVAIGVLMLNPRGGVHPTTPAHPPPTTAPQTAVVRPTLTPPVVGPPAGPTGLLLSATTGPQPPPPPDPHVRRQPEPPAPPIDTVPERVAANTVAQGRFRDATLLYDQLAAAHPDSPVYAQIATILRRKIEAQTQCAPGSSTQCAVTPTAVPAARP